MKRKSDPKAHVCVLKKTVWSRVYLASALTHFTAMLLFFFGCVWLCWLGLDWVCMSLVGFGWVRLCLVGFGKGAFRSSRSDWLVLQNEWTFYWCNLCYSSRICVSWMFLKRRFMNNFKNFLQNTLSIMPPP